MVPSTNLQAGQLVSSRAGRDKDKFYIVWKLLDESFVEVVDGDQRGLQKPKKKNIKHLQTYGQLSSKVTADAIGGLTDTEIRQELSVLTSRL